MKTKLQVDRSADIRAFTKAVKNADMSLPGSFEALSDEFLKIDTPEARVEALEALKNSHPDLALRLGVMCQELGMF